MRTLLSSLALLMAALLCAAADEPPTEKKAPSGAKDDTSKNEAAQLKVGNDLPGTFQPFCVTGPEKQHKQHFHCLISQSNLDPMVMIFYKNVDFSEPLPSLLKRLDTAIEKNPGVRLRSFVAFLPDELKDVSGSKDENEETNSKNDDLRIELAKKIEAFGSDAKLKNVVLCLASRTDVEKFGLSDNDMITVVLVSKLKVAAIHGLGKNDFTESAINKIMADVADKLGAKRK